MAAMRCSDKASHAATGSLVGAVGELACLRIIGDEIRDKGACTLTIAEIAARAGVSRTTVQNATRQATHEGLILVQERRQPGALNLPNKITIVSKEWRAWLVRGPRALGSKISTPRIRRFSLRPKSLVLSR